jgi:PAS domain S-box-containing protein
MEENEKIGLDVIVDVLLQVSDCVLEISENQTLANFWHTDTWTDLFFTPADVDRNMATLDHVPFRDQIISLTQTVQSTGKKSGFDYSGVTATNIVTYSIKGLCIHPQKGYTLITIERQSTPKPITPVKSEWVLALESSSDGVWDINLETSQISFTEKWHHNFGYSASEIKTIAEWTSLIHPDDLQAAMKIIEEHFIGRTPFYHSDIRIRDKHDGSYRWIASKGVFVSKGVDGKPMRFIGTHTDIHQQKIVEEKYHETAALLSKLINNLPIGIALTGADNKYIFVNKMFCEIYDLKVEPEALIGTDIIEGIQHRKQFFVDEEKFLQQSFALITNNEPSIGEEWLLKDERILSRDFIPFSLFNNKTCGLWLLTDITNHKNTEKRFEDQRNFYESILNYIPADIAVFDINRRYLFVNRHAFKNDELRRWMIGKTDIDYARYSNRPDSFFETRFAQYDNAVAQKKQIENIETLTAKDGTVGYHLRLMSPVFYENGELEMVLAYGANITDLIVAQEAMKTSADIFTSAFDYSGIGMAIVSPDGKWSDVNKALCKLTGYEKEELLQLSFNDLTYPADVEKDRNQIIQLLKGELSTYNIEKRYISKEKRIALVSITVSLVCNPDKTPKFFIAQVVDITAKKELENEINRKNVTLEATKTSLVNKINQLEELSHIIAHNLRGPANNIKMLTDVLLSKLNPMATDAEKEMNNAFTETETINLIQESSAALVNSLGTLMKITEIKLNREIPFDDCDVYALAQDVISQLQTIIYEKQAVFHFDFNRQIIKYPKAYLESILYNLISNALKYNIPGVAPIIHLQSRMENDKVQIIVKDNGMGLDLKRYGDKVFKLNQVFHKGYDSKGVGLYITKTQIESFGGTIEVHSQLNEGCEFVVTL